jgi:hypothetical protein
MSDTSTKVWQSKPHDQMPSFDSFFSLESTFHEISMELEKRYQNIQWKNQITVMMTSLRKVC